MKPFGRSALISLLAVLTALSASSAIEAADEAGNPPAAAATSAAENLHQFQRISGWERGEAVNPQAVFEALPRFGAAILGTAAPSWDELQEQAARAATTIPVPATYVIGPGDHLALSVWARNIEQVSQTLRVAPEGVIELDQVGRIEVVGKTLEDLRDELARAYRRLFTEPAVTLNITQQRVVEVFVTGDANRPGKYILPGMATVLTALDAAGGVAEIGSLRSVVYKRPGQAPVTVDLYDYFLHGRLYDSTLLASGDIIFVPALKMEVGLAGEVRRPARYELTEPTTIAEALQMAGGFKPSAFGPVVELWRAVGREDWTLTPINAAEDNGPDMQRELHDGDLLIVKTMRTTGANTALLVGAVKRPGHYPVEAGVTTVRDVLRMAEGLSWNAHMAMGLIERSDENRHPVTIQFNVAEEYYGSPKQPTLVYPRDLIEIFTQQEVEAPPLLSVEGAVYRPGVYQWARDMRISQLLTLAGGLTPGAYTARAELLRLTPDQNYEIVPVNLRAALGAADSPDNLALQRGDILKVRMATEVRPDAEVFIAGYVRNPGEYPRHEGMRISDLIFAAGGLKPGAGPDIEVTYGYFEGRPNVMNVLVTGELDDFRVEPDLVLTDESSVAVKGRGEFQAHADLVYIKGYVAKPGGYIMKHGDNDKRYTAFDLLQEAGGILEGGNLRGLVVYRRREVALQEAQQEDLGRILHSVNRETRQSAMQMDTTEQTAAMNATVAASLQQVFSSESGVSIILPPRPVTEDDWVTAIPLDGTKLIASGGAEGNLELEPGDNLVVPRIVNTVTILGAVPRSGAVPYVAGQDLWGYIRESGGFREDAAGDRMIVVHPNGAASPVTVRDAVHPGDVIVVPTRHLVRNVKTQNEWQRWLRGILSLVTAAIVF